MPVNTMTDMSQIKPLPLEQDIETKAVLKKLAKAHQALAELKGVVSGIPNQAILISTLSLQEAKDSSAIENIITTHDELYRSDSIARHFVTAAAKEVHNYATALRNGFEQVKRTGLLTNNDILTIQASIEENRAGFRKLPGTALKNNLTGETIYTPPQHPDEITGLMTNLERFINEDGKIEDDYRIEFIKDHLRWLHKGIEEGANCKGYHLWTPIDCWSWTNAIKTATV